MARLWTDGAEFGDTLFFDSVTGTVTAVTTTPRSGSYCYQVGNGVNYGTKNITAVSELYVRFALYPTTTDTGLLFTWFKGGTVIGEAKLNGSMQITMARGITVVLTGATSIPINVWTLVELRVKIDDAAGVFEIKLDGNVDGTFNGDTKPGADTNFDTLRFGSNSANDVQFRLDDLAADDAAYPGDGKVILLTVNAAGDVTQLTPSAGSNYQNVDDIPPDSDTTFNSESTATKYDLYGLTTFTISGNVIKRVWAECRAREETAAADQIKVGLKTNGVEYAGTGQATTTSYARYAGTDYAVNPQTSAAWTQAEFDALQARFEVV